MTSLCNIINSILIDKRQNFCCLCFNVINVDNKMYLDDEAIVNIKNTDHSLAMSEIIQYVLGDDVISYINAFDTICQKCTNSAISSYMFKQNSQHNMELLKNALDGLTNSFAYTNNDLQDSKSIFFMINSQDFTSTQFYDNKRQVHTIHGAIRRLQSLQNTKKPKLEVPIFPPKLKHDDLKSKKIGCDIKTSEMLFDKNNHKILKCKECFKVYPTLWNLRNHFIRVHAPKQFKCSKCPRSYGSAAFLKAHKTESHCPTVCVECGKKFNNRQTLKLHELGHNLTLVCPVCGRVYKNKCTYKKHIELNVCGQSTRAKPSEAKYTCDYCQKKYTQKVSLRVHIQYEHGNYKAHVCKWCGKKFWAQSRLKAHIVKHTLEKKFACSICNGKFVTKESLLYHTRRHTGEKPYQCSQCNSRFLSASRRTEHIKRHHSHATFECDLCHSKFNSHSYLQKHKLSHNTDTKSNYSQDYVQNTLKKLGKSEEIQIDRDYSDYKRTENQSVNKEILSNIICTASEDDVVPQSSEDSKVYIELSDDGENYGILFVKP